MLREKSHSSLTAPLVFWLIPQLISLLLSAARVPLSAHPPRPIESIALAQLAVVQIVAAAMLSPLLFRSVANTIAVILTAAPMLQLTGFLSSASMSTINAQCLLGASWAIALSAVCLTVGERHRASISAVATTWSLGGVLLAYLHAEFASARSIPDFFFGPALIAIRLTERSTIPSDLWWIVGAIPMLALAIAYAAYQLRRSNPREDGSVERNGNPPDSLEA